MRTASAIAAVAVCGLCALPARGNRLGPAQLAPGATDILGTMDSVPSRDELVEAFRPDEPIVALREIVKPTTVIDLGLQLRAIRALAQVCPEPCAESEAHITLREKLAEPVITSQDIMRRRAAIEAIGELHVLDDAPQLLAQLSPGMPRDVRSAAARALGKLCNTGRAVVDELRAAHDRETVVGVKRMLARAITELTDPRGCPAPPPDFAP